CSTKITNQHALRDVAHIIWMNLSPMEEYLVMGYQFVGHYAQNWNPGEQVTHEVIIKHANIFEDNYKLFERQDDDIIAPKIRNIMLKGIVKMGIVSVLLSLDLWS
ncbi:hypothetical protein ACJX0J_038991, partial [Zea mays]